MFRQAPVTGSHESAVQRFMSSQVFREKTQFPFSRLQESTVHGSMSLQTFGVKTQPVDTLQESIVQ